MDSEKNTGIRGGTDKTRTKLTEITLITPAGIHTDKTKHQNKV